jgi:hypothetical protein
MHADYLLLEHQDRRQSWWDQRRLAALTKVRQPPCAVSHYFREEAETETTQIGRWGQPTTSEQSLEVFQLVIAGSQSWNAAAIAA